MLANPYKLKCWHIICISLLLLAPIVAPIITKRSDSIACNITYNVVNIQCSIIQNIQVLNYFFMLLHAALTKIAITLIQINTHCGCNKQVYAYAVAQ